LRLKTRERVVPPSQLLVDDFELIFSVCLVVFEATENSDQIKSD